VIESPQKTERKKKKKKKKPIRKDDNQKNKMDGMNLLLDSKSKQMGETEK
jgi:hypothetical protein